MRKPHPTKYITRDLDYSDRYIYPVDAILEKIEELKAGGFTPEHMHLRVNTDFYVSTFSGIELVGERPKTALELEEDRKKEKELQRFKRKADAEVKKLRRESELKEYKRLKKKFEK